MQEQVKQQPIPVKVYRTDERLTLERATPTHGEHKGNAGRPATCVQT